MIVICPALRDSVKDRAGIAPVFSAELVSYQPGLLNGIRVVERNRGTSDAKIVVVLSVNHKIIRSDTPAVGGERSATGKLRLSGV